MSTSDLLDFVRTANRRTPPIDVELSLVSHQRYRALAPHRAGHAVRELQRMHPTVLKIC